jgi:hypothetical protein
VWIVYGRGLLSWLPWDLGGWLGGGGGGGGSGGGGR